MAETQWMHVPGLSAGRRLPILVTVPATSLQRLPNRNVNATDARAVFERELPLIGNLMASLGRRYRLDGDDLASLRSYAFERLLDDDCRILRRFEGGCSLKTYLTVVFARIYLDYCDKQWGRWRPSAVARRLGPEAVLLDTAMNRDGLSRGGAIRTVVDRAGVDMSEGELGRLADQIPSRTKRSHVGLEHSGPLPSADSADASVVNAELDARRAEAFERLDRALGDLDEETRDVFRLIYWEGMTVAGAARTLGIPQKPLYRAIEKDLSRLRDSLERAGLTSAGVAELLTGTRDRAGESSGLRSGAHPTAVTRDEAS